MEGTKIVLTGGPNAGKTTVIRAFQNLGFPVIGEKATEVIQEGRLSPISNPLEFRRETAARQQAAEIAVARETRTVIMDRGVYDGEGYCEATGCAVPGFLEELPNGLYPIMFLLESIPTWEADGVRYEDVDFSCKVNPIIGNVYRRKGARVVDVPLMTVQDRVELILSVLNEHDCCKR